VKVFLDDNVPAPLRRNLPHHQVSTAWEMVPLADQVPAAEHLLEELEERLDRP
jgi:hypothetical protein